MKTKKWQKKLFTVCLSFMLVATQCIGFVTVNAADEQNSGVTTYIEETFDSFTDEGIPDSNYGTWSGTNGYTLLESDGLFELEYANTGSSTSNTKVTFEPETAVSEEKLYLEFDYSYSRTAGTGGLNAVQLILYDSQKNYNKAQWKLVTGLNSSGRVQIVITNGKTVDSSSADVYIDGVKTATTKPDAGSKSWDGKISQFHFQTGAYAGQTYKLTLDNIKLTSQPTSLAVTSSLDSGNTGLPLGEDIVFAFGNMLDAGTVENAKVTANGVAIGTAAYEAEANTITFEYGEETPLAMNTTYTVDLSGVKDIFGNAPSTTSYTFTTVENAALSVINESFSVVDGVGGNVAEDGYFGGLVKASIDAINTTAANRDVMIAIAVYGEEHNMKTVHVGNTVIPATGVVTPATVEFDPGEYYDYHTDYIRVFVWNGDTLAPLKVSFDANEEGVMSK